jgi:hypothetical protein
VSFRSLALFSFCTLLAAFVFTSFVGCGIFDPKLPDARAVARGAVLTTAQAVKAADDACALFGTASRDAELLTACAQHYDAARAALLATASAVDLWDRVETRQSVTCALERALAELEQLGQDLASRGQEPPPVIADARALVNALGGCRGV